LNLFAALSVADGKVYGKCRLRKRFVDFQAFLLGTCQEPGVNVPPMFTENAPGMFGKNVPRMFSRDVPLHPEPAPDRITGRL
jgi:hypothetical protein